MNEIKSHSKKNIETDCFASTWRLHTCAHTYTTNTNLNPLKMKISRPQSEKKRRNNKKKTSFILHYMPAHLISFTLISVSWLHIVTDCDRRNSPQDMENMRERTSLVILFDICILCNWNEWWWRWPIHVCLSFFFPSFIIVIRFRFSIHKQGQTHTHAHSTKIKVLT